MQQNIFWVMKGNFMEDENKCEQNIWIIKEMKKKWDKLKQEKLNETRNYIKKKLLWDAKPFQLHKT